MAWIRQFPTLAGYYWVRHDDGSIDIYKLDERIGFLAFGIACDTPDGGIHFGCTPDGVTFEEFWDIPIERPPH